VSIRTRLYFDEHQIENDQVIGVGKGLLKSCWTIRRHINVIPSIAQMQLHQLGDVRIIFNDKNCTRRHVFSSLSTAKQLIMP
jgi:hypothetical protein